jgi:hypothetical protein
MSNPVPTTSPNQVTTDSAADSILPVPATGPVPPVEIGGRDGPDPTRYGDWEKNGRCIDF